MNKLFNWTFGSVFRTIGRVIGYLVVGALLGLILQKNGVRIRDIIPTLKISAKTFDTSEKYRIYKCDAQNDYENCAFTDWTNNGTSTSNNINSKVIRGFSMNFAQDETLNGGGHYRVYIAFDTSPQYPQNVQVLQNYNCFGVNSNSTSGGDDALIQSCELVSTIPTSSGVTYIFDVVPASNIKSIKVNIYLNTGAPFTSVKGLAKSNLSNDTATSDAINNQTDDLINNQNQNTQDIIDNQNQLLGTDCENLISIPNGTYSNNGITAVVNNGVITLNGTATETSFININLNENINILSGTYYRISANNNEIVGSSLSGTWARITPSD